MKQTVTTMEGEKVLLRPLRESDVEESLRVWTPELRHMYGGSLTAPAGSLEARRAGKRAWFERVGRGEEGHCFAIEVDGRYIGWATLYRFDEASRSAHWRGGIENSECWGRGYGTEVIRLMLRYGFETLELHRISLRVAAYNTRAIHCYQKCGFRVEGRERESFFVDGQWHDDLLMAILRKEWEAVNAPPKGDRSVRIRDCALDDHEQVAGLWKASGLSPRPSDRREEVAKKLRRDQDLFLVACVGSEIIGTVIGGWDGRRGWIYRMAVHPEHQRRGIGRALMCELEERLRARGALAINLIHNSANQAADAFYRGLGYARREGVSAMAKALTGAREVQHGS
jgi:RimJ/RimL family protein N-acetyltransferase